MSAAKKLRCLTKVVTQNAAESFTALKFSISVADNLRGIDESVVESLVVALFVIQPPDTRPTILTVARFGIPGTRCLAAKF